MTKKTFVLDTSIPVYDFECLDQFGENIVILPLMTIEEINHLKDEKSDAGFAASRFSEKLDELSLLGNMNEGVLYKGTTVRICNKKTDDLVKELFNHDVEDYHIIASAILNDGILVSRDRMQRFMARLHVNAEDYHADRVEAKEIYKGYRRQTVDEQVITDLYSHTLMNHFGLYPNEFILLENIENPEHTGVGVNKNNRILPLDYMLDTLRKESGLQMKIQPLNLEQKMYLYLLLDPDILAVSVMGASGRGKTLQVVDTALAFLKASKKQQLLYTKSIIPTDKKEELGFFPGDLNDKFAPYLKPLYNALEHLHKDDIRSGRTTIDEIVMKLRNERQLDAVPLALLRGSSIEDTFAVLDEAQNSSNRMVKTFLTRMVDTSKALVMGDNDQIDDVHLNAYNNGLVNMIEAGKTIPFIGHITLDIADDSRRGKLATFGSTHM